MTIRSDLFMCFIPNSRRCHLNRDTKRDGGQNRQRRSKQSSQGSLEMRPRLNLEEVMEWGKSFHSLMQSKDGRDVFRQFLKKEYSQENILFYEACEELNELTDEQEIFDKVRGIYEDYVSPLAHREVSLDSVIRDEINERMLSPNKDMFNDAKEHIYKLMLRDPYSRFKNSDIYRAALEESRGYI